MIIPHPTIPYAELRAFCERQSVHKQSLFGSVLRDDFRPDSDADGLIEFEPGPIVTYLDLARMRVELQDLFGRKVDLLTPIPLSQDFRDMVLAEAVTIYQRAAGSITRATLSGLN